MVADPAFGDADEQEAIDNIDRVGVFLFPSKWSRHDHPPMPEVAP